MVHIILPIHNRRANTENFVRCLRKQTLTNYHLLLVDDGSTDETTKYVQSEIPNCTVLQGKGNWWWAGSLDHAFCWLRNHHVDDHDIILIINNDVEFKENFISVGVDLLNRLNRTIVYSKAYSAQTGQLFYSGISVDWMNFTFNQASSDDEVNCVSTRGIFFRVKDAFIVGGFFPILLPHYLSDYEFSIRAHRRGYRFRSDDRLQIQMDERTTGYRVLAGGKGFFRRYFSKKNPNNPIYSIIFILLACPFKYRAKNVLRILTRAVRTITKELLP